MKADYSGTLTERSRAHCGWQSPTERRICANCKHVEELFRNPDTLYETHTWRCTLGSFATLKRAVCEKWESVK